MHTLINHRRTAPPTRRLRVRDTPWRERCGVALAAAGFMLMGGCGQSDHGATYARELQRAAQTTAATGSAHISLSTEIAGVAGLPNGHTEIGSGVIELTTGRARYVFNVSTVSSAVPAPTLEVVTDGATFLLKAAPSASRPWFRVNPTLFGSPAAGASLNAAQPRAALDVLRELSQKVQKQGSEDVRGTRADRYDFIIPGTQVGKDNAKQKALADQLRSLGGDISKTELAGSAWISADGLLRRFRIGVDLASLGSGVGGSVYSEFELFDFGTPVDVTLPPKDQVSTQEITTQDQLGRIMTGHADR